MKSVLSVDVAKNKSMFMLMASDGEIVIDSIELEHSLNNFESLKNKILDLEVENLTVFMESTCTYHLPVERYFKENGFNTLVINSLTTKNNYDTIRKTKTDKKDCYRLAKLFFVNKVEYHDLSKKDLYANLKALTRQYFYLVHQNISCKNRFKRLLNLCFPELESIFTSGTIYTDVALNFVIQFPHADIIRKKRIDAIYNNLYKTYGRHPAYYTSIANKIKEASMNSYPGIGIEHEDVKNLVDMAKLVQNNNNAIDEFKSKMIELAKESPYFNILRSFTGIGDVFAAEILGELGNITRFNNVKELIAFCGLDPTIIQSGKSINIKGSISKRGSKYARWILFNVSQTIVSLGARQCPYHPVYIYYQKKKAEGKHYYESLTACSTKILRMLYSMCKNNRTFLEK
jgi:transposase